MQARKDVMVYVHEPKKRLFHLVLDVKNNPDAIAGVLSSLGQRGVFVLSGFTNVENGGQHRLWSFFAESKNPNLSMEELKEVVDSSPGVVSSVVREGKNGFLVDEVHFPLTLNVGQRVVVIGQNRLSNIFRKLRESMGEKAVRVVYDEGLTLGRNGAQIFTQVMPAELIKENFREVLMIYSASGWGRPELVSADFENARVVVRISDGFECNGQTNNKPYSQFIRGHLCGLVSGLLGMSMQCDEVKCRAVGDGHCEFVISRNTSSRQS